jgi:hypothetical protein
MKILVMLGILGMSSFANADSVLSEKTVDLNVNISIPNVKMSRADYAMPVVKVLVPDLADVTILDHRNTGEGSPCLATYEAKTPEEVVQDNPKTELIPFIIRLEKSAFLSPDGKACSVYLIERVNGVIRGFKFEHERQEFIGNRNVADCR